MVFLLHIVFILSLLGLWMEHPGKKESHSVGLYILLSIGIILALIASLRPSEMPDYEAYNRIYLNPNDVLNERIELGFKALILFVKNYIYNNFIVFLFIAAFCSISLKLYAVNKLTSFICGSIFIYVCSKFISNDCIQMRVAFSTGFLLLAAFYRVNKQIIKFLLCASLAFLFHYSAILVFFIWFVPCKKIWKIPYLIILIGCYLLALRGFSITNMITLIPINAIQALFLTYSMEDGEANLFSILLISKILIACYFILSWEKYSKKSPYFVFMLNLFCISIVSYCLLFSINSVAVRIAELFQIVEVVLIPFFFYISKNRVIGKSIISFIGFIYFVFYVYFSGWL